MVTWHKYSVVLAFALTALGCASTSKMSLNPDAPITLAKQGSFFVGGRDVKSDFHSALPRYAPKDGGTVAVEQMYVRYQEPMNAKLPPLVLIHGCCLTGKAWETTPDGRMGWDELFVRRGFPTYVIDQVSRGRSAADTSSIVEAKVGRAESGTLPQVFNAARESAWTLFRFGPEYPKVFPGMQFPVEAQAELWKQMVPDWFNALPNPNPTVPALSQLAQKLNGAVLVGHSQSGIYSFQAAALNRHALAGIVAIEPGACPAPTSDMTPYVNLPILIVWGDNTETSSLWGPRPKMCEDFVAAANKAGAKAQMVMLKDVGFPGGSHMLMQDKHSIEIGSWLADWLEKNVAR